MTRRWHSRAAVLACGLILAACGGGGDEPSQPPSMVLAPIPMASGARIEPLDTQVVERATSKRAPAAASRLPTGAPVARVELAPLVEAKAVPERAPGSPLRIGVGRAVPATAQVQDLAALLDWHTLDDGARVAAVAFDAAGAQGVRLGVLVRALPDGAVLRFYGRPGTPVVALDSDALAALHALNRRGGLADDAARMVWGPDTDGAVSTLEVELPAGVAADRLQLAVPELSHLTQTVAQALAKDEADIGRAGSCNVDASCTTYEAESRSVAKMLFTRSGSSFLCTGTLLNDAQGSGRPYFLTASHCIGDQATASTLVTYWFFRAASCGAARPDPANTRRAGGAVWRATDTATDTSLLELNEPPPGGVLYAGSYFGPSPAIGADVLGLHHAGGDLLKASLGRVLGYANCPTGDGNCTLTNDPALGASLRLTWRRGTTEGGSSGSAIFAQSEGGTRYVVGVLHGGNASCDNPEGSDFYGRFERSFAAGLRDWLAP